LISLSDKRVGWYKNYIWYLAIVVIIENFALAIVFYWHQPNNYWIFNIFQPIQIGFISWLMYKITKPFFNSKWLIVSLAVISLIIFIAENY
ncbi:hypothetical protein ABTE09_19485, partial [Acinetobacter baumannii]